MSVESKLMDWFNSPTGSKKVDEVIERKLGVEKGAYRKVYKNSIVNMDEACKKLVECVEEAVNASEILTPDVKTAIQECDFYCEVITQTGTPKGKGSSKKISYWLSLLWDEEKAKHYSLNTERWKKPVDIVLLYNNGVDHVMNQVWGEWKTHNNGFVGSRTRIPAANFIEEGINDFVNRYSDKYGIELIDVGLREV